MARIDHYHEAKPPQATRIVPAVSAVLCDAEGKFILQRRSDNGLWALAGGMIEPGETVVEALRREVREETGYEIEIERLLGIYSDPHYVIEYSDGEVRQEFSICFAARVTGGRQSVSAESLAVKSFAESELAALNIHPAIRKRINDYMSGTKEPHFS